MPKFSKQDLEIELASVVMVMARQIEIWTDRSDFVNAFLHTSQDRLALDFSPSEIDLLSFPMAQRVLGAYGYAFAPTGDDSPDLDALHELADMLAGLPREDFGGDVPSFPNIHSESRIADVCTAVWARAAIDGTDDGLTTAISTRQLALLADMSEGAVRNAMTLSGEAGLKAIPKSKPVSVVIDEARRWLSGRRGFCSTPVGMGDDPILNERLRAFDRMEQLTDFIARHSLRLHGGLAKLADVLNWHESEVKAWASGTYQFDAAHAEALGKAIGADGPTFTGKAIELALRRNFGSEGI